jgi:hypothetical protein
MTVVCVSISHFGSPSAPDDAEADWEALLGRLEAIGARVECGPEGEAFFEADGLLGLWGGRLEGVVSRTRRAIGEPASIGVGPNRFCARAAASRAQRGRGAVIVPSGSARAFLAPLPVSLLRYRSLGEMVVTLERLGVRTLGVLATLPDAKVADRFGAPGLRALELARGGDRRLRPRRPREDVGERLDLPEAASGPQLERALGLLIDRLLARPERRGRTLRGLRLVAGLATGGGWRATVTMRRASASPDRLRLALLLRLSSLPAPAERIALEVVAFGPPAGDQLTLVRTDEEDRRRRLGEAVRQARAAAGREAVLRVLDVDPGSRVPERRAVLAPFPAR